VKIAVYSMKGFGEGILVSGFDDNSPKDHHVETVKWLVESADKVYEKVVDGLRNYCELCNTAFDLSVKLDWATIMVYEDQPLCCMIAFDALDFDTELYSFTGNFERGELVELSLDHWSINRSS